jgi:hypothetical protein
MPTIEALIGKVRTDLGSPRSDAPTDNQILSKLYEANQHYVNTMRLTQEGWYLKKFRLTVTPDTSTYTVVEPDFAGAFHVETDPEYYTRTGRRREVPIVNFQDFDLVEPRWQLSPSASVGVEVDTVSAIAFRNVDGIWQAVVAPGGSEGTYIVWYEPGFASVPRTLIEPQTIKAFHSMLALTAAHSVLPHCEWADKDPEVAYRHRQELRSAFQFDLARQESVFDRYRYMANGAETTHRQPFGRNRRAVRRARNPLNRSLNWP